MFVLAAIPLIITLLYTFSRVRSDDLTVPNMSLDLKLGQAVSTACFIWRQPLYFSWRKLEDFPANLYFEPPRQPYEKVRDDNSFVLHRHSRPVSIRRIGTGKLKHR
jgi:hypothetical protein